MMRLRNVVVIALIGVVLGWGGRTVSAADLKEGTVINAANLDKLKNDTFEGHTIASMLTEKIEGMIRKHGLKIKLRHSEEIPLDPRYVEATKKYSRDVKYDPKTRTISGYKAGLPFPNLSSDDPHLAEKLMWNHWYGAPHGDIIDLMEPGEYLYIDGKKGLERTQRWVFLTYYMNGRITDSQHTLGDGTIRFKRLFFAVYPQDIKGLGNFTIRYDKGKMPDTWAYIKSIRRVRRLSGGAWMDPIGGTDQLQDDINIFDAFPTWYPKYKVLGKRWVLAIAHASKPYYNPSGEKPEKRFPYIDLNIPPYWNYKDEGWEPREVWVIEATPPKEHPYSKKVMYLETKFPRFYLSEAYDKKGEFWKQFIFALRPVRSADGGWSVSTVSGSTLDFQRMHGTVFTVSEGSKYNTPGIKADDVTLGVLEAVGQGK